jgi:hypothetical protein
LSKTWYKIETALDKYKQWLQERLKNP